MIFDENMKKFIKSNLKLLTSKLNKQIAEIKRKKNDFWRNLKISPIPKNQDVAESTVKYLIDTKAINNQEELDKLLFA